MSLFISKRGTKPQSQAVKNGELVEKPRQISSSSYKPIVKPGKPAEPPRQSIKDRLASMSTEPMDPKADEWNKKVDIKAVKQEIKEPTTYMPELKDTHKKSAPVSFPRLEKAPDVKALEDLFDSLKIESVEAPDEEYVVKGLTVDLMEHQVAGVKFLKKREKKDISGGFLCDDMGLGKTVQSIALILKNKPKKDHKGPITTLVVGPLAVMDQWAEEVRTKAPKLSVITHQGPKRTSEAADLAKYNVVVTTYDTVVSEYRKARDGDKAALFDNEWYRIIADEAHSFRNPKSQMAMGMTALNSDGKRWALTGTPVHNTIDDLYALLKFIGVEAYADENNWKKLVSTPMKSNDPKAVKLLKELLQSLMLRREQKVIKLPKITKTRSKVSLDEDEKKVVHNILYPKRGSDMDTRSLTITRLMRIRQACDDIALLPLEIQEASKSDTNKKEPKHQENDDEFDDDLDDLAALLGDVKISITDSSGLGSKSKAIIDLLKSEKTRKTVVFSNFVSMLDHLAEALRKEDIGCKVYQGQLTASARQSMLHDFRTNKNTPVLLCSLNCAAVGINITAASRVIMVEPWWNPMIVDQAINRVHRIGQKLPVDVYEMMVTDSLEERIFALQDRKRALAKNMLERSDSLSKDEIKYLLYGTV